MSRYLDRPTRSSKIEIKSSRAVSVSWCLDIAQCLGISIVEHGPVKLKSSLRVLCLGVLVSGYISVSRYHASSATSLVDVVDVVISSNHARLQQPAHMVHNVAASPRTVSDANDNSVA